MTLSAKDAGVWKPLRTLYVKVAGAWQQAKGVWVKANGTWQLQGGSLTSVAVGGELYPFCEFDGPPGGFESGCTASSLLFAVPTYGWGTLTYQWQRLSGGTWLNLGTANSQLVQGGNTGYGSSVTVRVTVTDATGTSRTSPATTVTFSQVNTGEDPL